MQLRLKGVAVSVLGALALLIAACGGDDGGAGEGTGTPGPSGSPQPTVSPLPTVEISFETGEAAAIPLTVEVADDPRERSVGLMFRESMPDDHGMLFVFPGDVTDGFWMRNTLIPLSIAFVEDGGVIVWIDDMEPLTDTPHTPPMPYRYAIEVNQGWFTENMINVGDRVDLSAIIPDS